MQMDKATVGNTWMRQVIGIIQVFLKLIIRLQKLHIFSYPRVEKACIECRKGDYCLKEDI